jgi:VWFA-related protein
MLRAAGALVLAAVFASQNPVVRDERPYRSEVEVTSITATVRDAEGRLVKDLPRERFEVFEDGERQVISQFTNERVPISVAVALDASDSMFGRRLDDARAAVNQFVSSQLDPADEFLILAFNHQPRVLMPWTDNETEVETRLGVLIPSGGTAVYDAIMATVPLFEARTRQRAAVLIISDGADTASDASIRDIRSAMLRSDAFAYAVAIDPADRVAINTRVNPTALREITDTSGGRTEVVQDTVGLSAALASIAEELNSQYLIGYSSPKGADGQYHNIRVRISGGEYRVRARGGYIATPRQRPR